MQQDSILTLSWTGRLCLGCPGTTAEGRWDKDKKAETRIDPFIHWSNSIKWYKHAIILTQSSSQITERELWFPYKTPTCWFETLIEALILKPADKIYFNINSNMVRSLSLTAHMLLMTSWLTNAWEALPLRLSAFIFHNMNVSIEVKQIYVVHQCYDRQKAFVHRWAVFS